MTFNLKVHLISFQTHKKKNVARQKGSVFQVHNEYDQK